MKKIVFALAVLISTGCSVSSSNGTDGDVGPQDNSVQWDSVPSEFNPRVEDTKFQTNGIDTITLGLFNIEEGTQVIFSDSIPEGAGALRLFKVFKNSATWGTLSQKVVDKNLKINQFGSYACSIRIENRKITDLDGGCYIRAQVFLPANAKIEVYSGGTLISKRLFPMSNKKFLENFGYASFKDQRIKVINDYLASYAETNLTPSLLSQELGVVLDGFTFKNDKYEVLRKLHVYIRDRENLKKMIEESFSYFDRKEAETIVGL